MVVQCVADMFYMADHGYFCVKYNADVSASRTWRYVAAVDFDHDDGVVRFSVA